MARVKRMRLAPKRSLGQNFLIDDNIVSNIIQSFEPAAEDAVVEIGPGRGALTGRLADHVGHLLIVEIDGRAIGLLKEKFSLPHVVILHRDFLEVDLTEWQSRWNTKLRVIGNLPYHLTSPILFKVFAAADSIRDLTVMVQREVARRITAEPGTKSYGILSVMTRFYGVPKELFSVSPNCFSPKPDVTSTVIHIQLHETCHRDVNNELFRTVVRTTFGKRRKTLRNGLSYLPLDDEVIQRVVEEIPFPLEKRPEDLTVDQFMELTQLIERTLPR